MSLWWTIPAALIAFLFLITPMLLIASGTWTGFATFLIWGLAACIGMFIAFIGVLSLRA